MQTFELTLAFKDVGFLRIFTIGLVANSLIGSGIVGSNRRVGTRESLRLETAFTLYYVHLIHQLLTVIKLDRSMIRFGSTKASPGTGAIFFFGFFVKVLLTGPGVLLRNKIVLF